MCSAFETRRRPSGALYKRALVGSGDDKFTDEDIIQIRMSHQNFILETNVCETALKLLDIHIEGRTKRFYKRGIAENRVFYSSLRIFVVITKSLEQN